MDAKAFTECSKDMVKFITNYLENIRDRPVLPSVQPGYLRPLVPDHAPEEPETWQSVMADIERVIMPGVTHWHSPRFHAYFPTGNSYAAILADMLCGAIACIGFTWIASPACTELEVVMLDWLGEMIGLPEVFLARSGGAGGGVIQGSASEATLVALLGAKAKAIHRAKKARPELSEMEIIQKLVGYCSVQAHSSVERAGLLGGVQLKQIPGDEKHAMRGDSLRNAVLKDLDMGYIPFFAVATLGTTNSCAFDPLEELGIVCNEFDIWMHVDAAYAGTAFICPEFRYLMKGIELADSFDFNPHKWMLVNFDCSAMWLKEPGWVVDAFNVDPIYLKHDQQGSAPDYRHWQIPLGRRFRSLKLWFVIRLYGVKNLQAHVRKHVALAHYFEELCKSDSRFEVVEEVIMGLVCFRVKGSNEKNEELLRRINGRGKVHLVPSKINNRYFLRMALCSRFSEKTDIDFTWNEIKDTAEEVCAIMNGHH